ncbi:hypothetical protein KKA15_02600 [Patescibacteria group bacterium]|nr:hypothetical protein [Patescibacteria group bacterium]
MPKKQSKIEKLPLAVRKQILFISVMVLTAIIIIIWLISLAFNFSKSTKQDQNQPSQLQQVADELGDVFNEAKQQFEEIKTELDQEQNLAGIESELLLTPEQIQKIKKALANNPDWQIYNDENERITFKYPPDYEFIKNENITSFGKTPMYDNCPVEIVLEISSTTLGVKIADILKKYENTEVTSVTYGQNDFTIIEYEIPALTGDIDKIKVRSILIDNNKNTYIFRCNNQQACKNQNNIISTIQFTNLNNAEE